METPVAKRWVTCTCSDAYTSRSRHEPTWNGGNCEDVRGIVEAALAAERERCAKIAEFEHCGCKDEDCKQCAADFRGVKIAEEIRSGK